MKEKQQRVKNYKGGVSIVDNSNLRERMFRAILVSFGVLAVLYVIVLSTMILAVIERKGFENDSRALATDIGELELTYLSMTSGVDLELSHSLGFIEAKPAFAVRQPLGFNTLKERNIQLAQNEI